jgi:protein-L-isoaspartate(D-aspartate) O-methyltransferase
VIPDAVVLHLNVGGRLIIPIGDDKSKQVLIRVIRTERGAIQEDFGPCAFVPLIGEHGWD